MLKPAIRKTCSYRDCFSNNTANPELTFFAFPKDDLRAKIWEKFGATPDIRSCTGPKYLCEKHFSRIYMCYSPRRKLLLQTAVPYPYDETLLEEEKDPEPDPEPVLEPEPEPEPEPQPDTSMEPEHYERHEIFFLENESDNVNLAMHDGANYELTVEEIKTSGGYKLHDAGSSLQEERPTKVQKRNYDVGPLGVQSGLVLKKVKFKPRTKSMVNAGDSTSTDDIYQESAKVNDTKKKAFSIKMVQEPSVKLPATSSSAGVSVPHNKYETDRAPKPDPKISEFIFNGEMYVQMPKEHYEQQVKTLEEKVRSYETTMQRMRTILDEADDD